MSSALVEAPSVPLPEPPAHRCLLHRPPRDGRSWVRADDGYRTCSNCLDRVREHLREVGERWAALDPRPGAQGEHGSRGAPGFGSRSPGSDHVIAHRDDRSHTLARVWVGSDGKVHRESERPPLSVRGVLGRMAFYVAEARDMSGPSTWRVPTIVAWLDGQLDWITRQEGVTDFARDVRELVSQLRPITGEPGAKRIGRCPNVIDEGEHTRECLADLRAPLRGDEIRCRACGHRWPREEWLRLGKVLQAAA